MTVLSVFSSSFFARPPSGDARIPPADSRCFRGRSAAASAPRYDASRRSRRRSVSRRRCRPVVEEPVNEQGAAAPVRLAEAQRHIEEQRLQRKGGTVQIRRHGAVEQPEDQLDLAEEALVRADEFDGFRLLVPAREPLLDPFPFEGDSSSQKPPSSGPYWNTSPGYRQNIDPASTGWRAPFPPDSIPVLRRYRRRPNSRTTRRRGVGCGLRNARHCG